MPLEGGPGVKGKFGFTMRVPCGVVAAVTPFNFPLHLVCHKVGPALAGGNAVVIKPASDTPLSALRLIELLLEAGVPAEAVHCVTGSGAEIGDSLVSDPRVRKSALPAAATSASAFASRPGSRRSRWSLAPTRR